MMNAWSLAILVLVMCSVGSQDESRQKYERHAAAALVAQFETTLYARASFVAHGVQSKGFSRALGLPFAQFVPALDAVREDFAARILEKSQAILVGAKDFVPPHRLGAVRSTACSVAVLSDEAKFDLGTYFPAPPEPTPDGTTYTWTAKIPEFGRDVHISSFFATQIGDAYVVICNDSTEIQTLRQGLAGDKSDSIRAVGFPDWGSLKQAQFWCYRQYRHTGILSRVAAGMSDVTPSAHALFFVSDGDVGQFKLFAEDESTPSRINSSMARANIKWPQLVPSASSGVWQATIPLSSNPQTDETIFDIAGLFGFVVFI
jgi:hypothetical protein